MIPSSTEKEQEIGVITHLHRYHVDYNILHNTSAWHNKTLLVQLLGAKSILFCLLSLSDLH